MQPLPQLLRRDDVIGHGSPPLLDLLLDLGAAAWRAAGAGGSGAVA